MARTKASVGAKVAAIKSSKARCSAAPPPTSGTSGSSDRGSRSYSGGNPVCPRETPNWQKPITSFFITKNSDTSDSDDTEPAEKPKPKTKRNIIESDEECSPEKPKNTELDETIDLEPLIGEDSHKIEEYYSPDTETNNVPVRNAVMAENNNNVGEDEENNNAVIKTVKGKGVGKKTKGKENVSGASKRERDEQSESVSKRIKLD